MDFSIILGSIQIALGALQLKLDHFRRPINREGEQEMDDLLNLGEAIRTLEYALSETVAFIGHKRGVRSNPRLASLWEDASRTIRKVSGGADLADLTFEKNLYWRNPKYFQNQDENRLYRISLDNVLTQLRRLRSDYDKLLRKLDK